VDGRTSGGPATSALPLEELRKQAELKREEGERLRLEAELNPRQVVVQWYGTHFRNGVAAAGPQEGLTFGLLHPGVTPPTTRTRLELEAQHESKILGLFDLRPGLNLLFGDSGSGKTFLLTRLMEALERHPMRPSIPSQALAWGEPDDERAGFTDAGLTLATLTGALSRVWSPPPGLRVLWLDSLKYLTTAGGSQFITKKGMPKDQLAFLTAVSRAFLKWDQILVATLNPLEEDPQTLQAWADNFKGVVSQVIFIRGPGRYLVSSRFAPSREWRAVGEASVSGPSADPFSLPFTGSYTGA